MEVSVNSTIGSLPASTYNLNSEIISLTVSFETPNNPISLVISIKLSMANSVSLVPMKVSSNAAANP